MTDTPTTTTTIEVPLAPPVMKVKRSTTNGVQVAQADEAVADPRTSSTVVDTDPGPVQGAVQLAAPREIEEIEFGHLKIIRVRA